MALGIWGRVIVGGVGPLSRMYSVNKFAPGRITGLRGGFRFRNAVLDRLLGFTSSIPSFHELCGKGVGRHLSSVVILLVLKETSGYIKHTRVVRFTGSGLEGFRGLNVFEGNVPSRPALYHVRGKVSSATLTSGVQRFTRVFRGGLRGYGINGRVVYVSKGSRHNAMLRGNHGPSVMSTCSPSANVVLTARTYRRGDGRVGTIPLLLSGVGLTNGMIATSTVSLRGRVVSGVESSKNSFLVRLGTGRHTLHCKVRSGLYTRDPLCSCACKPRLKRKEVRAHACHVCSNLSVVTSGRG